MSKIILSDNSEIKIESGSSLEYLKVISTTKEDMLVVWNLFTEDNLKTVQIQNTNGMVVGEYKNLVLISETSSIQSDGSILTNFHLRNKTEVELLTERVNELEASVEADMTALNEAIGGV